MDNLRLSEKQQKTLRLVYLGYTVKEIAKKRKVSISSVYKILQRIADLGHLNLSQFKRGILPPKPQNIRLHGLMYQIQILYASPSYHKLLKKANIIYWDDFSLRLYEKSITVWGKLDFFGETANICRKKATVFINKTVEFLERKYNLVLRKKGYQNIREVRCHYAKLDDPQAKKFRKNGEHLKIRADDGKIWLHTDKSLNLDELETTHPLSAHDDMSSIIEPFYKTLKNKPNILNETEVNLIQISRLQEETARENLKTRKLINQVLIELNRVVTPKPPKPPEPQEDNNQDQDPPDYIN